MSTPCYKCQRRAMGCHAVCDDYIAYADERKEIREAKRATGEAEYVARRLANNNNRKLNRLS